jgi:hypothetical protein
MQKDYRGYLVMFGNTQLPNSFLTRYRSTPDQRIEKKALMELLQILTLKAAHKL